MICNCRQCGIEFDSEIAHSQVYCSTKCKNRYHNGVHRDRNQPKPGGRTWQKTCRFCGKEFTAYDFRVCLCSDECRKLQKEKMLALAGKKSAEETTQYVMKRLKRKSTVVKVETEARKSGLSYGMMMARKEGRL